MNKLGSFDWVAVILVIVGGLNWGLVGIFNYNLVTSLFGDSSFARIIFALVGLSAVYLLTLCGKLRKA